MRPIEYNIPNIFYIMSLALVGVVLTNGMHSHGMHLQTFVDGMVHLQ